MTTRLRKAKRPGEYNVFDNDRCVGSVAWCPDSHAFFAFPSDTLHFWPRVFGLRRLAVDYLVSVAAEVIQRTS